MKQKIIPNETLLDLFEKLEDRFSKTIEVLTEVENHDQLKSHDAWETMRLWKIRTQKMKELVEKTLKKHGRICPESGDEI